MMYPPEVIGEVLALNDIVEVIGRYVDLKKSGGSVKGLCPFHNEKTPSLSVSADKQVYHCFGCGAGGNVITFVMQIENYDFAEALKWLADRARYTLPQAADVEASRRRLAEKERIAELNKLAARFYYENLKSGSALAKTAERFLDMRGVSQAMRLKFGLGLATSAWDGLHGHLTKLGYQPDIIARAGLISANKTGSWHDRFRERIIFPILDINGSVIGFGGRILDAGEPKYLNSPETPLFEKGRNLYGASFARKAKSKHIIIVEGYMDVISVCQAGFANVVGVLGTALTENHARLLKKMNCESAVLLMDSDEAGTKAALRAIPPLTDGGLAVRVAQTADAKDPDEFIKKHGGEAFAAMLRDSQSHVTFRISLLQKKYDIADTEQRVAFTKEASEILAQQGGAIETDAYAKEISDFTGISPEAIMTEVRQKKDAQTRTLADRPHLRRAKGGGDEKGLLDARKTILSLMAGSPAIAAAVAESKSLSPNEMGGGVCAEILRHTFENVSGKPLETADVISRFETVEEQSQAAEIMRRDMPFENAAATEKGVNEMIRVIKRAHLNKLLAGDLEIKAANALLGEIIKLDKLHIKINLSGG